MKQRPVIVGAVLYEPKVSIIWDIIRDFFESSGCPMDVVFYTNYELQVTALLEGHLDIAWNSPLAWIDSERRSRGKCKAIAMRDTDRDRVSHLIAKKGGPVRSVEDLRSGTLACGAKDSPQATLIPIGLLQQSGLEPGRDFQVRRFDVLVGKHGDHVGGERSAFECLEKGEAAACAMLDLNWERWSGDGTINPAEYGVLATTDRFDHCVFTARADLASDLEGTWLQALFSMTYTDPRHREMMDMEGLKAWLPGRTTGFGPLTRACERQRYFSSE